MELMEAMEVNFPMLGEKVTIEVPMLFTDRTSLVPGWAYGPSRQYGWHTPEGGWSLYGSTARGHSPAYWLTFKRKRKRTKRRIDLKEVVKIRSGWGWTRHRWEAANLLEEGDSP